MTGNVYLPGVAAKLLRVIVRPLNGPAYLLLHREQAAAKVLHRREIWN
jgi:hypothetical protein